MLHWAHYMQWRTTSRPLAVTRRRSAARIALAPVHTHGVFSWLTTSRLRSSTRRCSVFERSQRTSTRDNCRGRHLDLDGSSSTESLQYGYACRMGPAQRGDVVALPIAQRNVRPGDAANPSRPAQCLPSCGGVQVTRREARGGGLELRLVQGGREVHGYTFCQSSTGTTVRRLNWSDVTT